MRHFFLCARSVGGALCVVAQAAGLPAPAPPHPLAAMSLLRRGQNKRARPEPSTLGLGQTLDVPAVVPSPTELWIDKHAPTCRCVWGALASC